MTGNYINKAHNNMEITRRQIRQGMTIRSTKVNIELQVNQAPRKGACARQDQCKNIVEKHWVEDENKVL